MKPLLQVHIAFASLMIACTGLSWGQAQAGPAAQPINAPISDYGTTFIFSPPPICSKCVETELGFQSVNPSRYIPAVLTVAPFKSVTDLSVLVNLLDSESVGNDRTIQFGNRFDFVLRQQVAAKGGFTLILAPRGTVFTRGVDGGRAGGTFAPQYSNGKNLIAANITWTAGIGTSAANPRSDYQGYADYFRALDSKGTTLFFGFAHELTAGVQTAGIEEGLVIPFRNGQVELESAQLDLNASPEYQFQSRVIVNWGKVLGKK
jgi:hypothetical protein